jgi:hypothetical protein
MVYQATKDFINTLIKLKPEQVKTILNQTNKNCSNTQKREIYVWQKIYKVWWKTREKTK